MSRRKPVETMKIIEGCPRKRTRHSTSEARWYQHKDIILELAKDLSYSEVRTILKKEHGFEITNNELQARLKTWGHKKNLRLNEAEKNFIAEKKEERDALHKKSMFEYTDTGIRLDPAKVDRVMKGYVKTDVRNPCQSLRVITPRNSRPRLSDRSNVDSSHQTASSYEQHHTKRLKTVHYQYTASTTNTTISHKSSLTPTDTVSASMVTHQHPTENPRQLYHYQNDEDHNIDWSTTSLVHILASWHDSTDDMWQLVLGQGQRQRPEIDHLNQEGKSPLNLAIDRKYLDHVKILLKHGADPNLPDENGDLPLHRTVKLASHIGQAQHSLPNLRSIIRLLVAHGADLKAFNTAGDTPLHLAVRGAATTQTNFEPFMPVDLSRFTVRPQLPETSIIKLLVELGADPDWPNKDGNSSMYFADLDGTFEVARVIRAALKEVKYRSNLPAALVSNRRGIGVVYR